ncbi:lyase family protein [Terrabacter sp. 2RAF25]|uniref:lyase family protein n=1 Tax=Terrabacter sp. 2RAF25 TaxID=3232998 RepID=UPI003F9D32F0
MSPLLEPGAPRAAGLIDDRAVLQAMLDVEAAWVRVQRRLGLVTDEIVDAVAQACAADDHDAAAISEQAEGGGNPVIPMLASLRERVREVAGRQHDDADAAVAATNRVSGDATAAIHRGLTSQDVVDTALMLLVARAGEVLSRHLHAATDSAARLAVEHRDTVQVARTLAQPALPTTFGLKAAGWLGALDDVVDELATVRRALPVQCGGAAGTLAAIEALVHGRSVEAAAMLADELDLADLGRPWHTDRGPMTRVGDSLVRAADAMGKVATDVVTLSRAEIAEVHEPSDDGRGGSSTLPQKRNPVLSVLVKAVAIEAPHLGATLHSAAGLAVDERPDGSWHAEWGAVLRLLRRVVVAAAQTAEILAGLEVDVDAMRRNVDAVGPALVAERLLREVARLPGGASAVSALRPALVGGARAKHLTPILRAYLPDHVLSDEAIADLLEPTHYLGAAGELVDRAVARHRGADLSTHLSTHLSTDRGGAA